MESDLKPKKEVKSVEVVDGVEVTTFADGSASFSPIRSTDKTVQIEKSFLKRHRLRPYAKIRNLSDPFGKDGGGGKIGYEFGLKFDF